MNCCADVPDHFSSGVAKSSCCTAVLFSLTTLADASALARTPSRRIRGSSGIRRRHSPAARRFEPVTLSAQAVLYSFTVIYPNPRTGQQPFALVYADFPEGARVFGRLALPEGARPVIGTRLETVIEPSSDGEVRYSFIPAPEVTQ